MNYFRKVKHRCLNCKKEFEKPPSEPGKYCSRKCMWEYKRETIFCRKCGKKVVVQKARKAIFCSPKCANSYNRSGENSHRWKGGIQIWEGYRMIWHPHHPFANKDGLVREHRLVMEKKLHRFLDPSEVVHHINGDKLDNRIENLELFRNHSEHMRSHAKKISH